MAFYPQSFLEWFQISHILSHHPHKILNYPRNSKGIHPVSHKVSLCPQPLPTLSPHLFFLTELHDLGWITELLALLSAVNGNKETNVLPCTQYSALHKVGILQLIDTERAGCFRAKEARVPLPLHLCFFSILFPVTKCQSWLRCLVIHSLHVNCNNSSSGKPLWALPHHRTTAISFITYVFVPTLGLCPRLVSDELCSPGFSGHQGKQTIYS